MTPERWKRVREVLEAALEHPRRERDDFLDHNCGSDLELRKEVESLIAHKAGAEDFLESPPVSGMEKPFNLSGPQARELTDRSPSTISRLTAKILPGWKMKQRSPGRWFFWGVIVVATILFAYYVCAAVLLLKYGSPKRDFGWHAADRNGAWTVTDVTPSSPVAGELEIGDTVLAVDGDARVQIFGPEYKLKADPPEGSYTVRVKRGAEELVLELDSVVLKDPSWRLSALSLFASSLAFYLISTIVGVLRPSDRIPRLMAAAGFACGTVLLWMSVSPPNHPGWVQVLFFPLDLIPPFHLLLAYRFFYWFSQPVADQARSTGESTSRDVPDSSEQTAIAHHRVRSEAVTSYREAKLHERETSSPSASSRFWHVITYGLWTCGILMYIPGNVHRLVHLPDFPGAMDFVASNYGFFEVYWSIKGTLGFGIGMAALLAMFGVLVTNYGRIEQPDQRRRIKWILYGTSVGVLTPALVWLSIGVLVAAGYDSVVTGSTCIFVFRLATALPILVPLALGHAVATRRAPGIDVVVRRGIQYLMAKNALRLILLIPIAGLVYRIVSNPDRTIAELFSRGSGTFYLLLLVAGGVSLRYRGQVIDWVDRKFFREKYDQERLLVELIENVEECDSLPEISRLVCTEVGEALHPKSTYVFYRDPERPDFALSYSSGGEGHGLRISENSELLRRLEQRPRPLDVGAGVARIELPEMERAWLDELGVDLVVPIKGPVLRLAGLLLLGEKKSEEPYSPNDKKLLQAIAGQVAVVCENIWLKQRVDRDSRIRRDVLAHLQGERVNLVKECPTCGTCFDGSEDLCALDRSELTLTLPVERVIEERYRLERVLGKGGMGAVYEATDSRLRRRVAVKIMMGHLFGQQTALRRFEREARASANLSHPNIIALYDYGSIGSDGAFLVMELIQGVTLRAKLQRYTSIAPRIAAEWFDQVLDGLSMAHSRGVIHRDLKPENVMIVEKDRDAGTSPVSALLSGQASPSIKILDFGLAKAKMAGVVESKSLTVPGTIMGTCSYMSPEQLSGGNVDERSDLFSIGVLVMETLTGRRPFRGDTTAEIMNAILHHPVHLECRVAPIRKVEVVLQKSLAKDREERFSSASEMRQALIPALQRCPPLSAP